MADEAPRRAPCAPKAVGTTFAPEEADPDEPVASKAFTFFKAFHRVEGASEFTVADPDNIRIDAGGGVRFGTDGYFDVYGHAGP